MKIEYIETEMGQAHLDVNGRALVWASLREDRERLAAIAEYVKRLEDAAESIGVLHHCRAGLG